MSVSCVYFCIVSYRLRDSQILCGVNENICIKSNSLIEDISHQAENKKQQEKSHRRCCARVYQCAACVNIWRLSHKNKWINQKSIPETSWSGKEIVENNQNRRLWSARRQQLCIFCIQPHTETPIMGIYQQFTQTFWSESVWLPPNISWADIAPGSRPDVDHADHRDLWWPLPIALILMVLRYTVEQ